MRTQPAATGAALYVVSARAAAVEDESALVDLAALDVLGVVRAKTVVDVGSVTAIVTGRDVALALVHAHTCCVGT
jgi:hypothetical protein